jgi:hypothetical protein
LNELNLDPDFDIDALMQCDGSPDLLCNVKVWLPVHAAADARVQVEAPISERSSGLDPLGLVKLVNVDQQGKSTLRFEASNVFIRGSSTRAMAQKTGRTAFEIGHIGKMRTEQVRSTDAEQALIPTVIDSMQISLSEFKYGIPMSMAFSDYKGNRKVEVQDIQSLRMKLNGATTCTLELHRHWNWTNLVDGRVLASSIPTLVLVDAHQFSAAQINSLVETTEDACVLLTLAARHRIFFYGYTASTGGKLIQEWQSPLNRNRAVTEEDALGPLVNESELESFFDAASKRWCHFDSSWRDAIRLAVFSIHPVTKLSIESHFLRMFAALEGLAGICSPELFRLEPKLKALLEKHPPRIGGLWPLALAQKDIGLNWFRDEIAHGRSMKGERFAALVLATDHLQLWLEHLLLAMLGFQVGKGMRENLKHRIRPDRLKQQVQHQNEAGIEFRNKLSASQSGT